MGNLNLAQQHLQGVGGKTIVIDVTPTLTVHATYAAGDYVGTSGVAMTFANAARVLGGTGMILNAELIDISGAAQASVTYELWLFDTAVTPPDDSAAWTLSDAHAKRLICVIPFDTFYSCGTASNVSNAKAIGAFFTALSTSRDIYGCIVARGAGPTLASGDLTIRLTVSQD